MNNVNTMLYACAKIIESKLQVKPRKKTKPDKNKKPKRKFMLKRKLKQ